MFKFQSKLLTPNELIQGKYVSIRLVTLFDCTVRYVDWLSDQDINQYLETRWTPQTLDSITRFVRSLLEDPCNYLFAIIENNTNHHIGNIKIGPINPFHGYADVSYFIGEKQAWGKGYATEAIKLIKSFSFNILGLNRLQAGVYASNTGSARALEKAGFIREAVFKKRLRLGSGWDDHYCYAILNDVTNI